MMTKEGHSGLSNKKVDETSSGEFFGALSYLTVNQKTAYFVIHVYSNAYDHSPYLQRSNIGEVSGFRPPSQRRNILERLGFIYSDSCNVLRDGRCYYQVLEEVDREKYLEDPSVHEQRVTIAHGRFEKFMSNLKQIYDKMVEVDRMLLEAGFELPWQDLKLESVFYKAGEKVYQKGEVYDFYKDIREITEQAKSEVFLVDSYPDEEVLNLYLEKIPAGIKIRVLIKESKGNFLTVAQKFKLKPGVNFEVRASRDCHDRLFFIDNACYVIGQSLKDAARKPTYLIKVESYDLFRKVFEGLWSDAQTLV
jgi:hypothetical protein